MSGWIKIHRCITSHWLYTEHRVYSKYEAWMDILLNVNFADAQVMIKGKLYKVQRGQSILSYESWGKRWNWDKSKVRRFMSLLQKDAMIDIKSDNITTHITVCNFDSYQDKRHADETPTKRIRNADATQTTPIEEEEEQKEEKKDKRFIPPSMLEIQKAFAEIDAERFYNYYQAKGWMIGSNKMKDWKAAARNWIARDKPKETKQPFQLRNVATLDDD